MSDAPFPPIETPRHRLRCVEPGDAAETVAMMTPAVSRWLGHWPDPFTLDRAVARIDAMRALAALGDALPLAITARDGGPLMGWVMVVRAPADRRRASLGYWLGEAWHGGRRMLEVAPAAACAGFERLDLDAVEATVQPANAGSIAVLEACGMRKVGEGLTFTPSRQREEFCAFYEVLRSV